MARPKDQTQRRSELVRVTSRLLVEHGAANARLTDIAAAANLTSASISYYYPNLPDLYAATYETATIEYITLRRQRAEEETDARERLLVCLRMGMPEVGHPSYDATILLIELSALGVREPGFAAAATEFAELQIALFSDIIELGRADGTFHPTLPVADIATLLLAAEDGIAPDVIAGRYTSHEAVELMARHAGVLLGCTLRPDPSPGPDSGPRRSAGAGSAQGH